MRNLFIGFNYRVKLSFLIALVPLLIQGCATVSNSEKNAELMNIKGSALTKLSAAVETTVSIDSPDESVSDEEIFRISTADDPSLLDPFAGYLLKINRNGGHAVILMCNKEGTVGLLEDTGCTGGMDVPLWQISNGCKFTISAAELCN